MLWVVVSASNWCNRLSGYYPELHLIIRSVADAVIPALAVHEILTRMR